MSQPTIATIEAAVKIVKSASQTARGFFRTSVSVDFKEDESPVTFADKTVESEIRAALANDFPGYGILGEEHGTINAGNPDMWIVDPIDGTRSFISGSPLFGMLLGLTHKGVPQLGVVSMPALREVFVGVPGVSASLNGDAITTSGKTDLATSVLYINEGEKIFAGEPAVFHRLMQAGQTRRFAYDCYPHALLAAGYVDVVIDYDLKPYDYLPVAGVVEGAGGVMTDWQGARLGMNSDGRVVSAATPELHAEILALLA